MHMHKNQIKSGKKRKILNYANMQKCTERAGRALCIAHTPRYHSFFFTLRAAHNNKYGQIDTLGKIKNTWQISGQTINGNY